ncbi:hypothetical protein AURDEDRAFT_173641 [Auricularia subglabra TFB-10046 SS5]|nr:hypothetical protein AURDEDRAFT_173641 [Auricularia subglabra TFB-10046 SS5]
MLDNFSMVHIKVKCLRTDSPHLRTDFPHLRTDLLDLRTDSPSMRTKVLRTDFALRTCARTLRTDF